METLYTESRFASKKAIKDAMASGRQVHVYSASLFSKGTPHGKHTLCGPTETERKFYAEITVEEGVITKIK